LGRPATEESPLCLLLFSHPALEVSGISFKTNGANGNICLTSVPARPGSRWLDCCPSLFYHLGRETHLGHSLRGFLESTGHTLPKSLELGESCSSSKDCFCPTTQLLTQALRNAGKPSFSTGYVLDFSLWVLSGPGLTGCSLLSSSVP
jgi:hypothetical protein